VVQSVGNTPQAGWFGFTNPFTFQGFAKTVLRIKTAGRGGFMRRFLTLVSLLCLALPAGITLTGCTRNPGANYCNGLGYGPKITDVYSITLQPQTAGISLSFGQTQQISTPSAYTCKGDGASVASWSYGTTNNKLIDISSSGMLCAGTWNRNTGGGISDYTICSKPDPLPTTNGLPYGIAYITATGDAVTSNAVKVYVHPQATSVSLVSTDKCYSQTQTSQLDSQACYASGNTQYLLCKPTSLTDLSKYACPVASGVTSIPSCSDSLGTMTYAVGNSSVASINSTTNVLTSLMPGTTNITASIASTASSAGYFSACPPASLALKMANGTTTGTVTQGVTQTLTATAVDTNGNSLTGLSLDYQSSNPMDLSVSSGSITASYPGAASVTAICQPGGCNPAPDNELGLWGTGLSLASNAVNITVPGTASEYVWFGAPGQSQSVVAIDMTTGNAGSTSRLPYVPNSMIMDRTGTSLYFGSSYELMIYSTGGNSLTTQNPNVPGVVLSVAPSSSFALINDQTRQILYLYNISSGSATSFSGMAVASAWTPDSKTMYAVDYASAGTGHSDALYVYNTSTGWSTYDLSATGGGKNVAVTVPSLGAYLAGTSSLSARAWCPTGAVGSSSSMTLYPQADAQAIVLDVLTATNDGSHILGAAQTTGGVTLYDLGLTIPTQTANSITVPAACTWARTSAGVQTLTGSTFSTSVQQTALSGVSSTAVNQVVTSPNSAIAFVTYLASSSNTGAILPYYLPTTKGTLGTVGSVTLTGASSVTAPVAGTFSPDNNYFFVSTAGDNLVHYIKIPSSVSASNPPTDVKQLAPALPACSSTTTGCTFTGTGSVVPATVIATKPRSTT